MANNLLLPPASRLSSCSTNQMPRSETLRGGRVSLFFSHIACYLRAHPWHLQFLDSSQPVMTLSGYTFPHQSLAQTNMIITSKRPALWLTYFICFFFSTSSFFLFYRALWKTVNVRHMDLKMCGSLIYWEQREGGPNPQSLGDCL